MKQGQVRLLAVLILVSGVSAGSAIRPSVVLSNTASSGWRLWLDRDAEWENDALFLPPVDLKTLPINPPTIGWGNLFQNSLPATQASKIYANKNLCMEVAVPGTVEQYFWDAVSGKAKGLGHSGNYRGVSWWGNDFEVPTEAEGKRIKLLFTEGIRQRAEVFVNQKLVGYELVHQTPFEVDITDAVRLGETNKLAVRITDANGNFSWGDYTGVAWGKYYFPLSHGFGGILGNVVLKVVDPVHVSDVFVKNKPSLTEIDADIDILNESAQAFSGTMDVAIVEAWQNSRPVDNPQTIYRAPTQPFSVGAGDHISVSLSATVPDAKLWGIRNANLYHLDIILKNANGTIIDRTQQRFGFRFLSVDGYGKHARFLLNGKRFFLLSSISWGFWPENGMFPTPKLARRHVEVALQLGQNMLNFHRCQGNSIVLNVADEMGLLYYEEPGGYSSHRTKDDNPALKQVKNLDLAAALNSQRLQRMVKAHRNHPSLVIYNMVNEPGWAPDERAQRDIAAVHDLDPTRFISYGSGFMTIGAEQAHKLHMLPYDKKLRTLGYVDVHNAGNSPGVYTDSMYDHPKSFLRNEQPRDELFFWGEEGAIASPPQLEKIVNRLNAGTRHGWDGADYRHWYAAYTHYINEKGLLQYYPSLTDLITSLGNIMYYEHGRLVENVRIADECEVYILNGFEDMKFDNFSGSVDVYRHFKGDPELINQYMKPAFVAVKVRNKVGEAGDRHILDLFVVNEHALPAGTFTLNTIVKKPNSQVETLFSGMVQVSGGDTFSDLVARDVSVALDGGKGYYHIEAKLTDATGKVVASGHDEIFAVDWKSDEIGGLGAVLGGDKDLLGFIQHTKQASVTTYSDTLPKLDYVVLGGMDQGIRFQTVPPLSFRALDRQTRGLNMDLFRGKSFDQQLDQRISTAKLDFDNGSKLIPGYDILGKSNFSIRWQGFLVPDVSGTYSFEGTVDDGMRIWFENKLVVDNWTDGPARSRTFEADLVQGKAYPIKLEAYQAGGDWKLSLKWKLPVTAQPFAMDRLLQRVKEDGTKLLIVEQAESWIKELHTQGVFPDYKVFHPATCWVGHNYFVREHPFFEDLPVNGGMNWEYQRLVVYNGPNHFGLYAMQGEEAIVSLVGGNSHLVSTAVGIFPYGKGKIAFSALDLVPNLTLDDKSAAVPRKILCNYLKWAGN